MKSNSVVLYRIEEFVKERINDKVKIEVKYIDVFRIEIKIMFELSHTHNDEVYCISIDNTSAFEEKDLFDVGLHTTITSMCKYHYKNKLRKIEPLCSTDCSFGGAYASISANRNASW